MQIHSVGIDLGKTTFHLVALGTATKVPIGAWLDALDARAPKNVIVVAMANKRARIAWAVLSSGNEYRPVAV
jgi:hypothetical protein